MINKIIEKRVIETDVTVGEECKCDVCGKIIYKKDETKYTEVNTNVGYWNIYTHHSDWGYGSVDSYESFTVCSKECLASKMFDYIESSANNNNSQEIECEHHNIGKI